MTRVAHLVHPPLSIVSRVQRELLSLLVCPESGLPLSGWDGAAPDGALCCEATGQAYRVRDGARVEDLARQPAGLKLAAPDVALVTIGGNDLLGGLVVDEGAGIAKFERTLSAFLRSLPRIPGCSPTSTTRRSTTTHATS